MIEPAHFLQKLILEQHSPSVQYILFDREKIISKYSYGLADISGNKQVNDFTTYNAYSVTKTFTALAILQLAEQGKLQIDEPVINYLPGFPYSAQITTRQLLSHSAGIPNPIPLNWIHLASEHQSFDKEKFIAGILNKNKKTKFQPGQKFAYSNLGYVLLGQLIERVAGTSYEEYIREHIIRTLGLNAPELGFEIPDSLVHSIGYQKRSGLMNLALGFFLDKSKFMGKAEGNWKPFRAFYVNGTSYGGLIGTPLAFVRYIQALLMPNHGLLHDDYKRMLFLENRTSNDKPTGMCLAWFTGQLNGITYFAHAGGGGGYYCEIRLYPERQIGSVIFLNRTGMSDERLLDKIDQSFFDIKTDIGHS